jgi:hypothetical protein
VNPTLRDPTRRSMPVWADVFLVLLAVIAVVAVLAVMP